MASKQNSGISIANVIALIGLAGIGVITFLGILLHSSEGNPGGAIVGAIALVAALGFLLWLSIKAKTAENNVENWRYVEWSALAIFIAVAVCFHAPFQRFFYITTQQTELKKKALAEVEAIKNMHRNYDAQQRQALDKAAEQLQNYIDSKQISPVYGDKLEEYVKKYSLRETDGVNGWKENATAIVSLPQTDKKLSQIEGEINAWNVLNLSSLAVRLKKYDAEAWTSIQTKIRKFGEENELIPIIGGGGPEKYYFGGLVKFELGDTPDPAFAKALLAANGSTVVGWIIYVLLCLFVIFNYFIVSRSAFVGPTPKGTTGGADL